MPSPMLSPNYLDPLFHDTIGQIGMVSAVLMTCLGFYIIRRIIAIEL